MSLKKLSSVFIYFLLIINVQIQTSLAQQHRKNIEKLLFQFDTSSVEVSEVERSLYRDKIKKAVLEQLYFHGTLAEYVQGILKEGLIPHKVVGATEDVSMDVCVKDHVYITRSFGEAYFFTNWAFLNKEKRENKMFILPPEKSRGIVAILTDFSNSRSLEGRKLSRDAETKGDTAFKYKGNIPADIVFNPFASPLDANQGLKKFEDDLRKKTGISLSKLSSAKFLVLTHEIVKEEIISYLFNLGLNRSQWIDPNF